MQSQRPISTPRREGLIVNRAFQYKYIWYFMTSLGGAALLFLLPSYFFVQQNYDLFKSLAFDTQPMLVAHLEREIVWLSFFMGASIFCLLGFTLFLSIRMTKSLLLPLIRMEKHMHQLMLGQWSISNFEVDQEEDFRDLSMTYDYLYRSLKVATENELKILEKFEIDPHNRETFAAWISLVKEKRNRLGLEDDSSTNRPENVVKLSEFDRKRHAS